MKIRAYETNDINSLVPLVDDFVAANELLSFKPDYQTVFLAWLHEIYSDPQACVYVAEYEKSIIAFAVGTIQKNGPLILPDMIGYISIFVVSSKYRRKGTGKLLYEKMKEWFLSHGVAEIQLYTEINNDEAKKFWENVGFDIILERRNKRIEI
jgi:ribosomal protein S18 acetylase RimI-like enzyme